MRKTQFPGGIRLSRSYFTSLFGIILSVSPNVLVKQMRRNVRWNTLSVNIYGDILRNFIPSTCGLKRILIRGRSNLPRLDSCCLELLSKILLIMSPGIFKVLFAPTEPDIYWIGSLNARRRVKKICIAALGWDSTRRVMIWKPSKCGIRLGRLLEEIKDDHNWQKRTEKKHREKKKKRLRSGQQAMQKLTVPRCEPPWNMCVSTTLPSVTTIFFWYHLRETLQKS